MPILQTYKVTSAFSGTVCTDPVNNTGCTSYQYNVNDFITSFGETKMSDSGIMYLIPVSGGPIPITNVENVGSNTGAGTGATGSTGATGATGSTGSTSGSTINPPPNYPTANPSVPTAYSSTTRSIIIVVVILLAIIGFLRVFKIV